MILNLHWIKINKMAKTKMTGFARLLIFLLFVLPIAFFGASYINGEDPIEKIKSFTGNGNDVATYQEGAPSNTTDATTNANVNQLEKRILQLERDLAISQEKLARCQTKGVE